MLLHSKCLHVAFAFSLSISLSFFPNHRMPTFLTHTAEKSFFPATHTKKERDSNENGYNFLSEIIWYFIEGNSIHVAKLFFFLHCNWNFIFLQTFFLHFPDAPVCTTDKIVIVGAYRSENLNVVCEVNADPPPRSFRWKFNSSGESYEIAKDRYVKNGSQNSILHYTPVMDQDYGTLTCTGQNEVGEQTNPCVFQVILAGESIFLLQSHLTRCQNIDDENVNKKTSQTLENFVTRLSHCLINFSFNWSSWFLCELFWVFISNFPHP